MPTLLGHTARNCTTTNHTTDLNHPTWPGNQRPQLTHQHPWKSQQGALQPPWLTTVEHTRVEVHCPSLNCLSIRAWQLPLQGITNTDSCFSTIHIQTDLNLQPAANTMQATGWVPDQAPPQTTKGTAAGLPNADKPCICPVQPLPATKANNQHLNAHCTCRCNSPT